MRNATATDSLRDYAAISKLVRYEPSTGLFRSRVSGQPIGSKDRQGYVRFPVAGSTWRAHRVAWLLMTGLWPDGVIDHINGNPSDNRFSNLRECTPQENCRNAKVKTNSRSGLKGAIWWGKGQRWRSKIRLHGQEVFLGYFKSAEAASAAYMAAAQKHYGEFASARNDARGVS